MKVSDPLLPLWYEGKEETRNRTTHHEMFLFNIDEFPGQIANGILGTANPNIKNCPCEKKRSHYESSEDQGGMILLKWLARIICKSMVMLLTRKIREGGLRWSDVAIHSVPLVPTLHANTGLSLYNREFHPCLLAIYTTLYTDSFCWAFLSEQSINKYRSFHGAI